MSKAQPIATTNADTSELLSWENLGAVPAPTAFIQSAAELMFHPRRFFRKMATTGGLHEPFAFLAVVLTIGTVLAFPAALSYLGLTAPDPVRLTPQQYNMCLLPARVTGLCLVLLPLTVSLFCLAAIAVGTVAYLPARLFGARTWEGAVSVWLYSVSAATMPIVIAIAATLAISLGGYLLSIPWPAVKLPATAAARWASAAFLGAGTVAGFAILLWHMTAGHAAAFGLRRASAAAASLSGLLLLAAVAAVCALVFARRGAQWGLGAVALSALLAIGVTVFMSLHSQRTAENG